MTDALPLIKMISLAAKAMSDGVRIIQHIPVDRVLDKFDLVIWNNVTGRVLKVEQQLAFIDYMDQGGGFLGIHGAGAKGYEVLYILDEKMINTNGNIKFLASDKDFGMGDDHPIVWYKQLPSGGRTLYSALGHGGDTFKEPQHLLILKQGILWAGKQF